MMSTVFCAEDFEPSRHFNGSWAIPNASVCLQQTILHCFPAFFLFITFPVLIYRGAFAHNRLKTKLNALPILKIILAVLLLIDGIFLCFLGSSVSVAYPIIFVLSLLLLVFLSIFTCHNHVPSSAILFFYSALLFVCSIPEFRYYLELVIFEREKPKLRFVTSALFCSFSALYFFLNLFTDAQAESTQGLNKSSELVSSTLTQITYNWFTPLVKKGYGRPLVQEDLWNLNEKDTSKCVVSAFKKHWGKRSAEGREERSLDEEPLLERDRKEKSLVWAILKTYKLTFLGVSLLELVSDIILFVYPYLTGKVIAFVSDMDQPLWVGCSYALVLFLNMVVFSIVCRAYYYRLQVLSMNIGSTLVSEVFSKALRLSTDARNRRTVGEIVNLMSVDVDVVREFADSLSSAWSGPLCIVIGTWMLWDLIGWSAFCGFVIVAIFVPVNGYLVSISGKLTEKRMKIRDDRLKITNEVIGGIKVIKFNAWEKSMKAKIQDLRENELGYCGKIAILGCVLRGIWACIPLLITAVTFAVFIVSDPEHHILTPQVTFVALSLMQIIAYPMMDIAFIFTGFSKFIVSNKRLRSFLNDSEIESYVEKKEENSAEVISITGGSFFWDREGRMTLRGIDFSASKGELIAVVGAVGSGKSSFLSALLGEMNKELGEVTVSGSIAYVPQQAWIQNGTLQSNVIFGNVFEDGLYQKVISGCALEPDIAMLNSGDQTEIGEKGINLSGGQKQRISLARAVYAQKDIYLFDDPLSAVDSHVAKHLFENVISSGTGLLQTQTRILVTHGLHFLRHCDKIVVLKDGEISESGTYEHLLSSNGAFSEFIEEHIASKISGKRRTKSRDSDADEEIEEVLADLQDFDPHVRERVERQISEISQKSEKEENEKKAGEVPSDGRLTEEETVETGQVKLSVYAHYVQAVGVLIAFCFCLAYVASSGFRIAMNLWLADWSDRSAQRNGSDVADSTFRLGIYTSLGFLEGLFGVASTSFLAVGMLRASHHLHEGLLSRVLRLPMAFFDVTPLGRILNRFGKDVEVTDDNLPQYFAEVAFSLLEALTSFIIVLRASIFALPVIAFLMIIYGFVVKFYIRTARQLRRLESVSRSPIYSYFQESIQGVSSIRAYKAMDRFIVEIQRRCDESQKASFHQIVSNMWITIRLEMIGNIIVLAAAMGAVFFRGSVGITAGLVGLAVTHAVNITHILNWGVKMMSGFETNIVAVERIMEYSKVETEAPEESSDHRKPPDEWPESGTIEIEDLKLRYRAGLDLVLNGISAKIASGEKIGIVGRTGAGKSSLTLALFRIVEAEAGRILIDGRDISQMGLTELRSRLTIVPQDPVLFSGTLRMNLDPFGEFSDDAIWESLGSIASLRQFISESLAGGLEHHIAEGGDNLSVGQRQLICLSRALLHRSRILVLDEAAAALDVETDALIQATIRDNFKHATVLTIAHRLNTVIDYDRILVLERGQIAEFDSPENLLAQPNSIFYSMVREAGIV